MSVFQLKKINILMYSANRVVKITYQRYHRVFIGISLCKFDIPVKTKYKNESFYVYKKLVNLTFDNEILF